MAVDDFMTRETDSLVLPPKTFYPLHIPVLHYQLRHFISSPEPDLIYYASGQEVYCLNVETKRRVHVATLPFEARCTASGYGWVCVGGAEEGHFAAIKLDGTGDSNTEVDSVLPLNFGSRSLSRPSFDAVKPTAHFERIGEEIVNSISIHKYPADGDYPEDVVAVLTNNDKTVRIYSLTKSTEITVLDLPFPMNHATISPNGQLMVAVGDYQEAYFFQRIKRTKPGQSSKSSLFEQIPCNPPEWTTVSVVQLHCPPSPSSTNPNTTGYFTTAWSACGTMCAVGSECGYVTVLDTELIVSSEWGEDAIVSIIPSSRPDVGNGPGAVRTMMFAPQPWDLLIWSEDQGRVCVADLRTGLMARQIIQLNPKEEDLEKIEIADFDLEPASELNRLRRGADLLRRYRPAADQDNGMSHFNLTTGYLESNSERRRSNRHPHVVESDNDPNGLTQHERQVLESLESLRTSSEALRQARDRLVSISTDAERLIVTIPRSLHYDSRGNPSTESPSAAIPSSTGNTDSSPRRSSGSNGMTSSSQPPSLGPSITSLRDFLRERPLARTIPTPPTYANRAGADANDRPSLIAPTSASDNWSTTLQPLADPNSSTPYPPDNSDIRRLRQLTRARERARSMREATARQISNYEVEIIRRERRRLDPDSGVRTTGLAMSQDGRTLFVGTEDGIFEYHINVGARKGFPALEPR